MIEAGDVVSIPPNVKHWHGDDGHDSHRDPGAAGSGKTVDWMEGVGDELYGAGE